MTTMPARSTRVRRTACITGRPAGTSTPRRPRRSAWAAPTATAGHDGFIWHSATQFRSPAFERDVTYVDGEIIDKIEMSPYGMPEIGRAHVCTPVTNAHLVCRL